MSRLAPLAMVALAGTALAGAPAHAASTSSGPIVSVTPAKTTLSAKQRTTTIFTLKVAAQAGERRIARADIVVDEVKGTTSLFVGLNLTCSDPSGAQVARAELGRNVWNTTVDFTIPAMLEFTAKTTGTYTCVTSVGLCVPGTCGATPSGTGSLALVLKRQNPADYTWAFISAALPDWAAAVQIPKAKDVLVNPGKSLSMPKTYDLALSAGTGPTAKAIGNVDIGAVISITNCIVENYPPTCNNASKMVTQGSSKVTVTLTIAQVPTVGGAKCPVLKAKPITSVITWQQHHAVFDIVYRNVPLKTTSSCGTAVVVTPTVQVVSGNSAVIEGGSKNVVESASYVLPGNLASIQPV